MMESSEDSMEHMSRPNLSAELREGVRVEEKD